MHFTSFRKWGILLKMQFCAEAPGKIWGQVIGSLDPRGGGLTGIPAAPAALPAGGGFGSTTCSPRVGWWPWFGRRRRRRGCSAMVGGGGRGGSGSGEGRAHGWQCMAWEDATGPRGCYSRVRWPRDEARRRPRRRGRAAGAGSSGTKRRSERLIGERPDRW
jgi:hypothetical protein